MPVLIVSVDLFLAINHVLRRRVRFVNQFSRKIQKHGAPVARHLLEAEKIDGYSTDIQRSSMADPLGIIYVNLNGSFNGATAYENAC